jgi:hypothetical protein
VTACPNRTSASSFIPESKPSAARPPNSKGEPP